MFCVFQHPALRRSTSGFNTRISDCFPTAEMSRPTSVVLLGLMLHLGYFDLLSYRQQNEIFSHVLDCGACKVMITQSNSRHFYVTVLRVLLLLLLLLLLFLYLVLLLLFN
jgi:hypothetical protein